MGDEDVADGVVAAFINPAAALPEELFFNWLVKPDEGARRQVRGDAVLPFFNGAVQWEDEAVRLAGCGEWNDMNDDLF